EIVAGTGLLRSQVEETLAELVAVGLVSSDSFVGLRALLTPSARRRPLEGGKRHRRTALFGIEDAGRWVLLKRNITAAAPGLDQETLQHIAWTLLQRYGVVFWRMLEREAQWLPPWRDLLRVLRRFEARGDIRGGRFVAGIPGEQFALPEAVAVLRETRTLPAVGSMVCICGADPLNLLGILLPGAKVPALTGNRLLFRDGVPLATLVANEVQWLQELPAQEHWTAENMLVQRPAASPLMAY